MNWPRAWLCGPCLRTGAEVSAAVRIFSGAGGYLYGGGGFAACARHRKQVEVVALAPLDGRCPLEPGYRVVAREVLPDDLGWPMLGRTLWIARQRER